MLYTRTSPTCACRWLWVQSSPPALRLQRPGQDNGHRLHERSFVRTHRIRGLLGKWVPLMLSKLWVRATASILVSAECGRDSGVCKINARSNSTRYDPEPPLPPRPMLTKYKLGVDRRATNKRRICKTAVPLSCQL